MSTPENVSEASNICLSCGLCCDGTLIGFVELNNEEIPAIRELMEIEEVNGKGFFLHPCSKFCDGCTVYSKRPKQCGLFKCGLLKSVEQKELDFDSAVTTIDVVKQQKLAIEKKIEMLQIELLSGSFYFRMVELKKLLKKKTESAIQTHQELLSDINQLDKLLLTKFGITLD